MPSALLQGASRPVASNQAGPHPGLARTLARYRDRPFRRPPSAHTLAAFGAADRLVRLRAAPVVIDSGCGTGAAAGRLLEQHPGCTVIAIDRSAARLDAGRARGLVDPSGGPLAVVRGNLVDFWPLVRSARWPVVHHYLLYPNPWPKARQLVRRWHAHPVFPTVVEIGGELVMRTNWAVYAEEFAQALRFAGVTAAVRPFSPDPPWSDFEAKYRASGHPLFEVRATLTRLSPDPR